MQEAGRILLMPCGDYSASETYEMLDIVNHNGTSWICKKECTGQTPSDSNTEYWQSLGIAADLSNFLPKNGGGTQPTISTNHPQVFSLDNVGENATTLLVFKQKGVIKGRIGVNWEGKPIYQNAEGANYSFLHTGNKPTGTYTGNGDATSRTVSTGGIGSVLAVYGGGAMCIVTSSGVMGGSNGGSTGNYGAASFANGILTISTDNAMLNKSNTTYTYQVL